MDYGTDGALVQRKIVKTRQDSKKRESKAVG